MCIRRLMRKQVRFITVFGWSCRNRVVLSIKKRVEWFDGLLEEDIVVVNSERRLLLNILSLVLRNQIL